MRQLVVALGVLLGGSAAFANGRPAATSTINFRQGHESDVLAGMTFGAVISHDSGATWEWICEDAIGYAGVYDPDYVYLENGQIYATTFRGLVVNKDSCTWEGTSMGMKFSSAEELSPTGSIHLGVAHSCGSNCTMNDAKIYRSDDNGATWPVSANPGMINDWWQTMVVSKSDPNRLYVSGFRFVDDPGGGGGTIRVHILLRSEDKGATFEDMSQVGLTASDDSVMEIAGISPTNPDIVFLRVTFWKGVIGDAIYRSVDGGQTWTKIYEERDSLAAFVVRSNGDVVVSAPSLGGAVSTNCKTTTDPCTFTPLEGEPHLSCLVENALGEVWGCTQNFGGNQVPGDGFGIMKTTDLMTWTGVLKFQDIKAPITCPAGTVQKDMCEVKVWCALRAQLGITADAGINCEVPEGQPPTEQLVVNPPDKSCCGVGGGGGMPTAAGWAVIGYIVLRRRRTVRA